MKPITLILVLLVFFALAACGGGTPPPDNGAPEPPKGNTTYNDEDLNADEETQAATPEDAYIMVFAEFYPLELLPEKGDDPIYISVDMDGILHRTPDLVRSSIEEYLIDADVILLWENMDSLIEKGHIIVNDNGYPEYFENGSLFSFNDINLTDSLYEASPSKWFGNLGAEGATYKVSKVSGEWEISDISVMWVS